jgi:hypothetical protein
MSETDEGPIEKQDGAVAPRGHTQRKAIVASIVASLMVLYFLDPILSFLGRLTLRVASTLFTAYLDGLYAEVAAAEPNFGFLFLVFVAGSVLGLSTGYVVVVIIRQLSRTPPSEPRWGYANIYAAVLFATGLFLLAFSVDSYIRLKTTSTFNQRLAAVTPYISDQQRKELLARFASMEHKSDFEAVMRAMDAIATENKIVLPTNRLYRF